MVAVFGNFLTVQSMTASETEYPCEDCRMASYFSKPSSFAWDTTKVLDQINPTQSITHRNIPTAAPQSMPKKRSLNLRSRAFISFLFTNSARDVRVK